MRHLAVVGLVAMLGASGHAEPQAGVDLAQLNGWDFVVGDAAIPSERYAAEEFQRLVEQPPFGGTQFFYWEFEGTQGCLKGETLLVGRDDPQEYPFITETTSVNGVEVLDHIRVDTPEPVVFENPYKQYGVAQGDDQDEVARADILIGFYEALVNDKPVQYPPDTAWRDQEMVVALMESARLGSQWLDLPLKEETQVEKDMHDQYLELYGHPWHDIDSLIKSPLPRGGVRWAVMGDL